MGGGRNPPLRRIDGDPFHPQRSLAGQEMVVKRLRSDRRDQWPDFSSPYAGYSFLQSLSGSSTISYMTGLSKPSRAYLASRRPILRELRLDSSPVSHGGLTVSRPRNRKFESISLQRRVLLRRP